MVGDGILKKNKTPSSSIRHGKSETNCLTGTPQHTTW